MKRKRKQTRPGTGTKYTVVCMQREKNETKNESSAQGKQNLYEQNASFVISISALFFLLSSKFSFVQYSIIEFMAGGLKHGSTLKVDNELS